MSSTFLATISLPDNLKSVWKRLPNKSRFVAKHLKQLAGFEEEVVHTSWSSSLNMCNMFHTDGVCQTCMNDFQMIEFDIIQEYETRQYLLEEHDRGVDVFLYWRGEEE